MKTKLTKDLTVKNLATAIKKFNGSQHMAAIMYCDLDDGEVWTNHYANENSWSQYDKSIIPVISRRASWGRYGFDEACDLIIQSVKEYNDRCSRLQ